MPGGIALPFKDGVARIVGGSTAHAVRDWVRVLLGGQRADEELEGRHGEEGLWGDDEDESLDTPHGLPTHFEPTTKSDLPGWLAWRLKALAPAAAWLLSMVA